MLGVDDLIVVFLVATEIYLCLCAWRFQMVDAFHAVKIFEKINSLKRER
jgi:hypothetical protein